ncbi:MAG: hypothetical protein HND48_11785 [Chloroflexi bacterium]|nr:hypothetical protein [Chloroflexota bacterium]
MSEIGQYRLLVETAGETPAPAETSAPDATSDAPAATPEPVATTAPATDVSTDATDGFQPGQVLTTTGLQVRLDWLSTADLNLEVRDPFGERLFFDSRTNQNGGTFGFDVNGLCEVLNSPATETATYAPGAIPSAATRCWCITAKTARTTARSHFRLRSRLTACSFRSSTAR